MNCQAFRNAWINDTDNDDLFSHIETCEACITWIETQMASDEEVQFLKEIPSPPANLEERIMQAIYQASDQTAPPLAATIPLPSAAPAANAKGKKRTKGFPSYAWVSAAAVLLAVGVVGYQQLSVPDQFQTAAEPVNNQAESSAQIAMSAPQASPAADAAPENTETQASGGSEPQQQVQEMLKENGDQPPESAASVGIAAAPPVQEKQVQAPAAAKNGLEAGIAMAGPGRGTPKENRGLMARDGTPKPVAEPVVKKEAAPSQSEAAMTQMEDRQAVMEHSEMSLAAAAFVHEPVYARTGDPDADMSMMMEADTGTAKSLVGPPSPAAESTPITLSTFTDVETAVQASDMPVPVLAEAPEGFAMSGISIRYESETSQHVALLLADYQRNQDWIKIEVVRNKDGKRSLSIPGTFTATHLFSVNNEQAIGVSYEKQPKQETTAQHAVHFNASAGDQSLYVVLTAHGISLDELMELSKKMTWKP
ncbi:hypothetical protein [Brevibacillus panacihumi]|uniref:Uncharacterized protein n=1 Tax=Brevibacillus panacihumi TaxID=497735 RepID=A0A3M8CPL7_9BACL|nr:hypothetical protein [Brevibacillus panacihumi]RNB77712.1 hypothetical protein EDM58_13625 [Brevibacillus panacihumi]